MKISFQELLEQANETIDTIPAETAVTMHGDASAVFVDLRDVRELEREGMIAGAYHCPRGMLEFWVHPESPYHKPIFAAPGKTYVLYCASGWRSALSAATLTDLGMTNVAHVGGGYSAWKAAGGPTAEKASKA